MMELDSEYIERYGNGKDGFKASGVQANSDRDIATEIALMNDKLNEILTFVRECREVMEQVKPFMEQVQANPMGFLMMLMGGK